MAWNKEMSAYFMALEESRKNGTKAPKKPEPPKRPVKRGTPVRRAEDSIWETTDSGRNKPGRPPKASAQNNGNGTRVDPFRAVKDNQAPNTRSVVRGIIADNGLIREIVELLYWTERKDFIALCESVRERQDAVLSACENGTFGRDYVATNLATNVRGGDSDGSVKPFTRENK